MNPSAPSPYKSAGTFMLVSGITSALCSLVCIAFLIWICIGAFWIGTLIVSIFEIVIGVAVMGGALKENVKTISILGLIGAFLCGNIIGMVLEILVLVNLGKPEVEAFLADEA